MTDRKDIPADNRKVTLVEEQHGLTVRVEHGCMLNKALERAGVHLEGPCGGRGTCGQCEVVISGGEVSPPTRAELRRLTEHKRLHGHRLACQTRVLGDVSAMVREATPRGQRILTTGVGDLHSISPRVRACDVALRPPSLEDPRGDDRRLAHELSTHHGMTCVCPDVTFLRDELAVLRTQDWRARVLVRGNELIGLKEPYSPILGLAVDIGTTGIAAYLCDLEHGHILGETGILNPQHVCGEDIITRIDAARRSPEQAERLQHLVVQAINRLTVDLTNHAGHEPGDVAEFVIVANTAMHHLFLGLPLDQLARAPHVPAVSMDTEVKARQIGLVSTAGAYVCLPPNPAAFVGSDHLAMLAASGAEDSPGPALYIDIGTNTEICLVADETMTCVSCASDRPLKEGISVAECARGRERSNVYAWPMGEWN